MKKRLYWWHSPNFGDALNPYIQKAMGQNVTHGAIDSCDIVSIGSLFEGLLKRKDNRAFNAPPCYVWGAGFHFEKGKHLYQKDISMPEKFARKIIVKAVRGKLSLERVKEITGNDKKIAMGDPALLASKLFNISPPKKKAYSVGIVSHFLEKNSKIFKDLNNNLKNSVIIDVEQEPLAFIKKILDCETIISTALHPIIIADSYGIPNQWINFSENNVSKYKFSDYYSVFDERAFYLDLNKIKVTDQTIEKIKQNYKIKDVAGIQKDLIESHPFNIKIKKLNAMDALRLKITFYMGGLKFQRVLDAAKTAIKKRL